MADTNKRAARKHAVEHAERMKGFDFATWRSASDDPVMRSTILGLIVLEESPDWATLKDRFDRVSRLAPVLRKKVVEHGLLTTPRLIVDKDFDLSFHLRRFRMPAGSTWADVIEDCRRQSMTDFDKDRPLWRVTVLEGLPGGKAALLLKLHHAMIDGQGVVILGANLFDFSPDGQALGPMPDEPEADDLDTRAFAEAVVRDNFGWAAKTAQDFIRGIGPTTLTALRRPQETVTRVVNTAGSLVRFTKIPTGPMSPLMKERSINYHFRTIEFPFAYIKKTGKETGHTANDVFLAAVSEGMGIYHRKLGQPVDKLRVNVPISTRKPGQEGGNAVTIARLEMPIATKGRLRLMEQMADLVRAARDEPAVSFTNELGEISRLIPTEIVAAAAQASDVTASNVPGVPVPVWLAGAQIERMYPLVATIGAGVNITMLTYNGTATIGISSDDAAVADPDVLLECMLAGFSDVVGQDLNSGNPVDSAPAPKKAPAKKAPAKKAPAKKAPAKKAPAKKAPAKKAPAKKAPAKKAPAKKAPAKKAPAK